ncbi:chemotaxis response regulator protein-glutamate methylesterase [Rhodoblastus sphagnicola]|uniref:Protein-glutamate methylesterase/protein-glutamine glutaminase n=1 Tax=Rhodoblastus sphagnicola TaxID=333368 RepID=A0A2S6MU01_9HYPH|nr:chemotaxis response regulator protein-glutamate methylesterase [Rhodoblastus sphagnicola]MBB4199784.1 two-component system chemotaxis response regulator CheB [Rhodoblastus sphagnicola]PPQ25844.1 chemotaxis response regulator protein-glutamate methylesterase [Rhodoblastus sphagnicola]
MKPVRVLVVDDSATMRAMIAATLSRDAGIEVVGMAGDPIEARAAIKQLNPDVMTLDVEMPKMDGLNFLEKVMRLRPMPVVMVSSQTARGASATLAALELGAVTCVGKPTIEHPNAFDSLPACVLAAAGARVGERMTPQSHLRHSAYHWDGKIVAIGASTGCVEALLAVLASYPADCPPTLVAVHMPGAFTKSFAKRLNAATEAQVAEAEDGAPLETGRVWLAPGGVHIEATNGSRPACRLRPGEPGDVFRPSVNALFHALAKNFGKNAVGVILTGMGDDGADGLLAMRAAGARTLAQDEATSMVHGMPRAAKKCGAVESEAPLHEIGRRILDLTFLERR